MKVAEKSLLNGVTPLKKKKKNKAISDGLNKCDSNKMNYYYMEKRADHL